MSHLETARAFIAERVQGVPNPTWGLVHVDHLAALLAAETERCAKVLEWYAEKARAIRRYCEEKPVKAMSIAAVVAELELDGGERAAAIREGTNDSSPKDTKGDSAHKEV